MTSAVLNLILLFSFLLSLCVFALIYIYLLSKKVQKHTTIASEHYLIIYASQSGYSKYFAEKVSDQLTKAGEITVLLSVEDLSATVLQNARKVIWLVSTYGEGDHPDTARQLVSWLYDTQLDLDLSEQSFIMLGFGDRHYDHFCGFAEQLNKHLLQRGAQPWQEMMTVDQLSATDLQAFAQTLSQITRHRITLSEHEKNWFTIQLQQRVLLNAGSQGNGLYHLIFSLDQNLDWKSGDLLEIKCQNTTKDIARFLANHPEMTDLTTEDLKFKNLRSIKKSAYTSKQEWLKHLEDLPTREYSIANIPHQSQLELVVRQEINQGHLGLGSGLLTEYLNLHEAIYVNIRSNPAFHLNSSDKPAIFIGNGSGIAGLLAHLHQREQLSHQHNWLIYGERQSTVDRIFDLKISKWQSQNTLTQVHRAYSRDIHAPYKYVQDVLKIHADEINAWVKEGASIYICGSLKGMAKDVHLTLIEILGETQMNHLLQQHRYCRDVY